jgi:2-oxoglutarate ferredoxin oxidoreductase subunit delta
VEFCPPKVLVISNLFNDHGYHPPQLIREGNCTGCDLCGLYCPDFAIYGVREPVEAELAGRGVAENSSEPLAVIEKERAELVQGEGGRV